MGTKNAYLMRMQAQTEREMRRQRMFTIQQCLDMLMIAAADEFGFGPDRLKRLGDRFTATFMEYVHLCLGDAEGDKDIEYTRALIDRKLRQILGDDNFTPWDERYSGMDKQ